MCGNGGKPVQYNTLPRFAHWNSAGSGIKIHTFVVTKNARRKEMKTICDALIFRTSFSFIGISAYNLFDEYANASDSGLLFIQWSVCVRGRDRERWTSIIQELRLELHSFPVAISYRWFVFFLPLDLNRSNCMHSQTFQSHIEGRTEIAPIENLNISSKFLCTPNAHVIKCGAICRNRCTRLSEQNVIEFRSSHYET